MAQSVPRYTMEEHVRRGEELYQLRIRPLVEEGNKGKIVAIDIETGEFELGDSTISTSKPLLARLPDAQIWYERIGYPAVYRLRGSIGMELLRDRDLKIEVVDGGSVTILPRPVPVTGSPATP